MNRFVENKDRWLQIANGEFEYSIMFIKSWLPFNAWYCNNYPDFNNSDKQILTEVKSNDNLFKTRIISLLDGDNDDAVSFRKNLVQLCKQLKICKVPNTNDMVTFEAINFRVNPISSHQTIYRAHTFKAEFILPQNPHQYRVRFVVLNSNNVNILPYQHTKYDIDHLQNNSDFRRLTTRNQDNVLDVFMHIDPKKKESLIVKNKRDALNNISEILFTNNLDLLAQAIIEVLYRLRCILFHGQIIPNRDNLTIYEPAFYMLRLIIKALD
jgi:hypothetical protein